ncbi:hypothetical protein CANARDRAFT_30451 [[Candida] arabinofermentans NRRL YB-2248]|uniref:ADIPOR-like receptor IZH3 n=1 Tax=[Candida] arabinofermentans NRRL YB-2248 TaxID=983967 RepID=A0A1E4SU02_9ASCO|nr:hypothetical protein CANARDRAFT_30451 [[Candida] arabinofermentans NRRL YB-2248]
MSGSATELRQVNKRASPAPMDLSSESDSILMERIQSSSSSELIDESSIEEKILEKLDIFLQKLESKIESFENYFSNNPSLKQKQSHSNFYKALTLIKDTAIKNQNRSFHPLSQILDNCYGNLFNESTSTSTTSTTTTSTTEDVSSSFSSYKKLLAGLQFLDEKIDQFETTFNIPCNSNDKLKQLKDTLYNYEKAMVAGTHRLLHFYELPFQWRENKYIIHGYRFNATHKSALKSICECHNETANIWTHLLGALLLIYMMNFQYPNTTTYANSTSLDHMVVYFFFLASIKCLLSSVIWHTYTCIGKLYLRQRFACIDYTGITVLITASIITTEHIALYDSPILRIGYMSFSTIAGIIGVFFTWSEFFDKPESRPVRILFFVSLSALGIAAFFTVMFYNGLSYSLTLYSPLLISFMYYWIGVVFYGCLIPEKWRSDVIIDDIEISDNAIMELDSKGLLESYLEKTPEYTEFNGNFKSLYWVDFIFSSHHIWHIFVLLGVIGHYNAILKMFDVIQNKV